MSKIEGIKRKHDGSEVIRYEGEVVARGETWVCLRARLKRDTEKDAGYTVWRPGDLLTEWHYSDKWYNVFHLQDVRDGSFKGWYCNITRPAHITETQVWADDLALDVYIYPNREILILDEDEFEEIDISGEERKAAWDAVAEIKRLVAAGEAPFRV